jgi:hypothetical protein
MKKVLLALVAVTMLATLAVAETQTIPYGFVQTWFSHASNGLDGDDAVTQSGFGLKRARLGVMLKGDNFMGNVLVESAGAFALRDAYIDWYVNDMFTLTMGRFRGVGCQAAGLTGPIVLDLPEYGLVGKGWAGGTVGGDARTIGMQLSAQVHEMIQVKALMHNGDGATSFLPAGNATDATGLVNTDVMPQMDFGVYVMPLPFVKGGVTYGMPNEFRNTTGSMTGFLYANLGILYAKFDYAQLMCNPVWDDDDMDFTSSGMAFTGGYTVMPQTELVVRYDTWDADTDIDDNGRKNLAFGVNYSFNEDPAKKYQNRVQLSYTMHMDETPDGVDERDDKGLIQLMWTYLIK